VIEVNGTETPANSNVEEGTPHDNPPVGSPGHLVAQDLECDASGAIEVTWQASPDDGAGAYTADEYFLYRKYEGGSYEIVTTLTAIGATEYRWEDSNFTNSFNPPVLGFRYWYYVTAYDSDTASESEPSNEDDALSDGSPGAPEITAGYDIVGMGSRAIRVEWLASADDGSCSDSVMRYHIYRTTTPGEYGTYIGSVDATDSASYSWDDNIANSAFPPLDDMDYWYVIRAYDPVEIIESQNSNEFGPIQPFGANCECCPLFVDDMESGNVGWSSGASPSYKNDWAIGSPNGKSFDPSLAYSGGGVWGTDLGEGSRDGQYRSSVTEWLISPTLDVSAMEDGYVVMSYYRWLSVETHQKDKASIQIDTGSGWQIVWQNSQNGSTVDTRWRLQMLDLTEHALGHSNVRIAFVLETNSSQQFGGWNIDDVEICFTAPGDCDYFRYVGDSIAENQGNILFFEIRNASGYIAEMQGMYLNWSEEGSLLKEIAAQGGGPGLVWEASVAQGPVVEAMFTEVVPFDVDEAIRFKLTFQPGQMRGSAMMLRFITACGTSTEIVIQIPD
jgi:hypothetical protein